MTAKAFILIETAEGQTRAVLAILSKSKGVKSVNAVTGPYDIIAVVEGKTLSDVGDIVTGKIHPIAGISRTVTCLAL